MIVKFQSLNGRPGYVPLEGGEPRYPDMPEGANRVDVYAERDGAHLIETRWNWDLDQYLNNRARPVQFRVDLRTGERRELFAKGRPCDQTTIAFALSDGRVLAACADKGHQWLSLTDWDGENWRALTPPDEGFVYGLDLRPDEREVAFHCASTGGDEAYWYMPHRYSINTLSLDNGERRLLDSGERRLLFGPRYSPDGKSLAYVDCDPVADPAHYFSDVCVWREDRGARTLTDGKAHYFGTSFGSPERRGGGSNTPCWMPDGKHLVCALRSPGAHPDARFDAALGNHRENVFDRSAARGGCALYLLDAGSGARTPLTAFEEGRWDFRPCVSPDGAWILFTSARVAEPSEIRAIRADGTGLRALSRGEDGLGADFAGFAPNDGTGRAM